MNVSVVVTSWNSRLLLEKNLPQVVKAAGNSVNKIKEILVVDDYSSDGSVDFVRKNFPQVKIVSQPKNFGYARTCNTGVNLAENELVVILNADVIPTENFLSSVLPAFTDRRVFAVSFNEGKFGPGKLVWQDGFWEIQATAVTKETSETDWASGGSSIFRKKYWQQLGGMNELFLPFYFEDVDLGLKAKKAGFICLWEPKAKVEHKHEATINQENFRKYKNRRNIALVKERNHLLLTWQNINDFSLWKSHFGGLLKRLSRHPGYAKVIIAALWRCGAFCLVQRGK